MTFVSSYISYLLTSSTRARILTNVSLYIWLKQNYEFAEFTETVNLASAVGFGVYRDM